MAEAKRGSSSSANLAAMTRSVPRKSEVEALVCQDDDGKERWSSGRPMS